MSDIKDLKKQRDRFIAFAFASSDLFIEVSAEGKIVYAMGASKGMTGFEDHEILGKNWIELFSVYDQGQVRHMYENAPPGKRCGPLLVELSEIMSNKRKAILTAFRMPEDPNFYITLGLSNLLMSKLAGDIPKVANGKPLNRETFIEQTKETLETARSLGQEMDMTLLDFTPTKEDRERLGEENWGNLLTQVSNFLRAQSVDGQTAAEITEGRYGIVHEKGVDGAFIRDRIEAMAQETDPTGNGIEVKSKTVAADISKMSEHEAARALVYTINEFEREGTEMTIESLNTGITTYVKTNAKKLQDFQKIIKNLDFSFHFQPIVDLKTNQVSHYEMLCRFEVGDTMEWVMFGEDMGMAADFDLAVCERAITHIKFKAGGSRTKFAVNLSGQSIQKDDFFTKLQKKLAANKGMNERMMFEITESSHIKDLDKVNEHIQQLQADGYKVALDDFGAGSASFQYLQTLKVDTVKIDGKYIRKLLTSDRDATMVKSLTQLCKNLGIGVVAEYVEEQAQVDMLREMGVDYGQGYLFGKPSAAPSFTPAKK